MNTSQNPGAICWISSRFLGSHMRGIYVIAIFPSEDGLIHVKAHLMVNTLSNMSNTTVMGL